MLSTDQIETLDGLSDKAVDAAVLVPPEEVDRIVAVRESKPDVYDRWNVWNSTVGNSVPVVSGSAQSPPDCQQDGNSPCASCDCC